MGNDHEDDGDTLGDGYDGIPFHRFNLSPLQPWSEQMSQPASEPLPPGATALIFLFRQEVTLFRVFNEFIIQLTRDVLVDDQGIDLIVEAQTAGIEVRTANSTVLAVDHHDL